MFALVQKSTTSVPLLFFMVQSSDHITALTGASPTVTISKNGAAFGSPSGSVTEIANGWYQVAGNATDTNTFGAIALHATAASGDPSDCIPAMVVGFDPSVANLAANMTQILGTAVSAPATAGILDVNTKNMNNVAATSITTIAANQGTTQPVNFTGTGASALVKSDMVDIAGAAVSASTAQLGVNVVNIKGTASAGTAGYAGIDWGTINAPTSTVDLSGTTIKNLDNTPPGGPGTAAQIATAVWQDATAGDFTVSSSIGKGLFTSGVVPGGAGGLFIAGTNAATTVNITGTWTGSLTGSVGSISGVTFPANFGALVISAGGRVSILQNGQKNAALPDFEFQMVDSTTFLPKTGLTVAGQVSLDGAPFVNLTNSASEVSNGAYVINLAAADMNANVVNLKFTASGAAQTNDIILTTP